MYSWQTKKFRKQRLILPTLLHFSKVYPHTLAFKVYAFYMLLDRQTDRQTDRQIDR